MRKLATLLLGFSITLAGGAEAQTASGADSPDTPPAALQPPTPPPDMMPPAPPAQPPSPPAGSDQSGPWIQNEQPATPSTAPTTGQWVYTDEYGWIWMPYGNQYTYEGTSDDAYPYSYVYYPSSGWMWLAAPWVWGWGPHPYFGPRGPAGYGWYVGLYHAGYGWGRYRGGGPSHASIVGAARASIARPAPAVRAGGGTRSVPVFSAHSFSGHVGGGHGGRR